MDKTYILTDVIIAGSLHLAISLLAGAVIVWYIKRKIAFLWCFPVILFSILYIVFLSYTILVIPQSVQLTRTTIDVKTYDGEPFHIGIISDLHVGEYANSSTLDAATALIRSQSDIDVFFILGDFVNATPKHFSDLDVIEEIASDIPTYAVLGNHDYIPNRKSLSESPEVSGLSEYLEEMGVSVLHDSCTELQVDNYPRITLFGGEDLYFNDPDFSCIKSFPSENPLVVLSHSPDVVVRMSELDNPSLPDLILSGHTHGGELRLPMGIAVLPLPLRELPQSYDEGIHTYQDIPVFITSGLGTVATRLRTWNNPEVVILEIR